MSRSAALADGEKQANIEGYWDRKPIVARKCKAEGQGVHAPVTGVSMFTIVSNKPVGGAFFEVAISLPAALPAGELPFPSPAPKQQFRARTAPPPNVPPSSCGSRRGSAPPPLLLCLP